MIYTVFERELLRLQIFEIAVLSVTLILTIMISYYILKIALREAIRESGLIRALNNVAASRRDNDLPSIRAD